MRASCPCISCPRIFPHFSAMVSSPRFTGSAGDVYGSMGMGGFDGLGTVFHITP
ncbi:MAG: hypothetical protein WBQ09_15930 [Terriglobales bacterium]